MIQGTTTISLCDDAVKDALTRYLCDELKSPVKVTAFKRIDSGYGVKTVDVEFTSASDANAAKGE